MVQAGKLVAAIKALKPLKPDGPWRVLCDNEGFLQTKESAAAHKAAGVKLWRIPSKSPDLNPIELFWGWLRKKLKAMDLADALKKRKVLSKVAYTRRVKRVLQTKKAQQVAANCAKSLKNTCKLVLRKKGAESGR